jgi:TIR domain/WD domain, G-beta repeat
MPRITISYRRADSAAITGRIFDRLVDRYGRDSVFRDFDSIPLGVDFRNHIAKVLDESDIVLVVIGQRWIGGRGAQGRLGNPADPVRIEVETALKKGIPVIPILVGRVGMPQSERLPESLRDITYRNALQVDDGLDFDHHLERLIRAMDGILAKTAAPSTAEGQRGPERIGAELRRWKGHAKGVRSVAVLPDGRRALSGSEDNTTRLWDLKTGGEVGRFEGHTSIVLSVAALPNGRQALSGSFDHTMRLWDLEKGVELRRFEGHSEWVETVAVLSDGRQALSGSGDRTIRLWDLETGVELRRLIGHTGTVSCVAALSGGRRVLSGSHGSKLRLWDLERGLELRRFDGHELGINSLAALPDGRQALSGSADKTMRLWDLESGAELRRFEGHASPVTSVAVLPDGGGRYPDPKTGWCGYGTSAPASSCAGLRARRVVSAPWPCFHRGDSCSWG